MRAMSRKKLMSIVVTCGVLLASGAYFGFGALATTGPSVPAAPGGGDPATTRSPVSVTYPRNASGLTYGSMLDTPSPDQLPDLISAIATNGRQGFVLRSDLFLPGPKTPEQAIAMNAAAVAPRSIPVYAVDGTTIIGTYVISPAQPQ